MKTHDQILTKSVRLQLRDFRMAFSVFHLIYMYYSLNSILKKQEKFKKLTVRPEKFRMAYSHTSTLKVSWGTQNGQKKRASLVSDHILL